MIQLLRVDHRLLHGQVATTWTKQINPNRIIVVSDGVAHDELRKTMIEQAAPPGVHANVVPIKKMAEVVKDTRFGDTKAMLLFENPQDLLKAIEAGVDIKEVNIGSMAHSKGKVVVTNAVAMGDDDVKTLEALKAKGVKDARAALEIMARQAQVDIQETIRNNGSRSTKFPDRSLFTTLLYDVKDERKGRNRTADSGSGRDKALVKVGTMLHSVGYEIKG